MKRSLLRSVIPWLITAMALYYAFSGVDLSMVIDHIKEAERIPLVIAALITLSSYLVRTLRWQILFLKSQMNYFTALRVLILGFFMNNILPARAGELVRAHMGARASGETRTLVLATIASERLVDGLTISLMFVIFAAGVGDPGLSHNLMYVALAFGMVTVAVLVVLAARERLFALAERINSRYKSRASAYTLDRVRIFINGLKPLFMPAKLPSVVVLSIIVWSIELAVYFLISRAFDASLSISLCVLFLVAVNFSSLIPAAPGGIGVIEAVASAVLISVGVPREQALSMALCQHFIQYLVVGVPGLVVLSTWKKQARSISELTDDALAENKVEPPVG
ncbi:MAG: flippase-like domain-containing protein [Deltaproteobacteria bacterium]|nr:flippase-like domain-containing protein [Deltaproteobacteria bacterium]